MRARLARLYYHLATTPSLEPRLVELSASMCMTLIESRKRIDIKDLVLPWRLLYDVMEKDLFPKQRRTGLTNISSTLLDLAEACQRFFHPSATMEMLNTFLPKMDGNSLDSVIATQAVLVHFLPTSHGQPQVWLKMMFRLSETFNSSLWDDQMLDLLARLSAQNVLHPEFPEDRDIASTVAKKAEPVEWLKRYADAEGDTGILDADSAHSNDGWQDVGILTDQQFELIMTKCLRSAGLPVGANKAANRELMAQSSATRAGVDAVASGLTINMKKPSNRLQSFAGIIAYSLRQDAPAHSLEEEQSLADGNNSSSGGSKKSSLAATPEVAASPAEGGSPVLGPQVTKAQQTFLAGSKALDHFARYIQATESFFHPSNWGAWQIQLTSFVKFLSVELLRRIKEEEKPDCKVAQDKRITREIRRSFVKITRNVCLMSMFGKDPISIANSQLSLRNMALLEPDLVIPEIFSRAVPSLEALETTHRTASVISCLGTLSFAIISREHYREGAKNLVPLLNLCLPGIDLNDPLKTIATTAFYTMASIYIKIDDLNRPELASDSSMAVDADPEAVRRDDMSAEETREFDNAQDQLTRLGTSAFEDWAVTFFRRVLQLFDSLPEEGKGGKIGGKSEQQVVTSVLGASDMICANMSPQLFDTCFDVVAEHCASSVSANSVTVVGALVGSFARADSGKVLKRLLRRSMEAIRVELDSGASSVMTTKTTEASSSDTTLHWHLHILIHCLSGSGPRLLPYKDELLSFLEELVDKCKNERTYSVTSRLVQKVLIVTTFYYPNETHCVTPETWCADDYERDSHLSWGQVYPVKDAQVSWHVPAAEEIDMALELLERLTMPLLDALSNMLEASNTRNKAWSADFCRRLSYVKQMATAVPHLILLEETGAAQKLPTEASRSLNSLLRRHASNRLSCSRIPPTRATSELWRCGRRSQKFSSKPPRPPGKATLRIKSIV